MRLNSFFYIELRIIFSDNLDLSIQRGHRLTHNQKSSLREICQDDVYKLQIFSTQIGAAGAPRLSEII